MTVSADTKIHDLLETYPYLKPWLVARAPEFKKLENPVLYNTMARVATLEAAAAMADTPLDTLLEEIRTEIARHEIVAEEVAGAAPRLDDAERARRQDVLKELIRELHDGASTADVKARFDSLVADVDAAEVAMMEQALIAEGMPVEEVQRLCDVHVTVFKESLDDGSKTDVPADHPIDAYLRENAAATRIVSGLRGDLDRLSDPESAATAFDAIESALAELSAIETHFTRKEHQLFPALESHGVEGPTKVMWAIDDDIRARVKTARALAEAGDLVSVKAALPDLLGMVDDMIYKEEKILFPTALQVVTAEEWVRIASGYAEIGFAWVGGPGEASHRAAGAATPTASVPGEPLVLPLVTGGLTVEQLNLMLTALPFDVSFVDENDRVRFYSEGERVFPRSPGAIGREVRNCHPPASVDKVEQILAAFKAGEKDVAEFWIEMGPRFIHIRYFAMRDADGTYRGCLEVVQDATHVRALQGQRRLVNW
jgi:DUF438 domain-containing protein